MKIYFVRHGHPDYKHDCLTPLGKLQAAACAERLRDAGLCRIYASTNGRATETAEYTAKVYDLPVIPCDFMREIGWKSIDEEEIPFGGNPWNLSDHFASEGVSLDRKDWGTVYPYNHSILSVRYPMVTGKFDELLAELGYVREGDYYRVTGGEFLEGAVAVFSHGGSGSAVISHLLNIPYPQVTGMFSMSCTSVSVVELSSREGELVLPKLRLWNDDKHIKGLTVDETFGI
ncbi:MAG: histidine phosphatase family protein [Clostridia bacterium]|nr:histidine phosphatase family protein [Clostridia bacterium]